MTDLDFVFDDTQNTALKWYVDVTQVTSAFKTLINDNESHHFLLHQELLLITYIHKFINFSFHQLLIWQFFLLVGGIIFNFYLFLVF